MHNGLTAFDPELAKARLQAGFLDVTFSLDATFNLSVKADLDKAYPLSHWRDYARTLTWLRDGEAHFEIWFQDKRIFEAQVSDPVDGDELPIWLTNLVDVTEKLKQIAGKVRRLRPSSRYLSVLRLRTRLSFSHRASRDDQSVTTP